MANLYEEHETQEGVLSITEFAQQVRIPMSISISSSRNTGKTVMCSVLIKALLKSKKVDMVLVMSQTQHVNDDYKFLPARLRQPFSEDVIKKLMDKQGKIPKKKRDEILLVLDDVLSDKEAEKSRFVKKLYTLGRHYNISIILISQTSNVALTPAIKQNSDYLIYSRLNRYMLESLWASVCNIDKKSFIAFSEENNKDYRFIVVDSTSQSNNPADFLLIIRATPEEAKKISPKDIESDAEISSEESEAEHAR
jgi:hypothetical protein